MDPLVDGVPRPPRHDPWTRDVVLDIWHLAIADEHHHRGVTSWLRGTMKPRAYDERLAAALRERGAAADDESALRLAQQLCVYWASGGGNASEECRAAARKAVDRRRLLRPGPVLAGSREELDRVFAMPPVVGVDEAMGTRVPSGVSASPPVVTVREGLGVRSSVVPSVSPPVGWKPKGET